MAYTMSEAAQATGRGKTTILRMVKAGKLSGWRGPLGVWMIEPAELHRLYPPVAHNGEDQSARPGVPRTTDMARDSLIAAHERTIEDLRRRLDAATEMAADALQALQQIRLLADQRARRPWWSWRRK